MARIFHSPGRVNLIGDHIDYLGGSVLPMAIDRGTTLRVEPRTDHLLLARSAQFPEAGWITADSAANVPDPAAGWANHLVAVLWALRAGRRDGAGGVKERGDSLPGFTVDVEGTIPYGAGLSSSASLEVGFATAVNAICDLGLSPTQVAEVCQQAENGFIGVNCGIMDQLAVAMGRRGHGTLIDCRTRTAQWRALPEGVAVVVADSRQRRELSESAYNDRRADCEAAEAQLGGRRLVDVSRGETESVLTAIDPELRPRARHVILEQQRVFAFAEALQRGELDQLGTLMRQSHESLRDDFEVTGPALDALAEAAWQAPGVIGSRMTGAGFGGCTVSLVHVDRTERFAEALVAGYQERTGLEALTYVVAAGDGAHEVHPGEPEAVR